MSSMEFVIKEIKVKQFEIALTRSYKKHLENILQKRFCIIFVYV